jgi:hypothetical protein
MTGARLLTYDSACSPVCVLHIPHAVMSRMFPTQPVFVNIVNTSEVVE